MEPYENLANVIILQAVKDYRQALRYLKRHPHTQDLDSAEAMQDMRKRDLRSMIIRKENERDEIEQFFRSGWFEALSNLNGEALLSKVRAMEVG